MTTIEGYLDSATVILFGFFVKLLLASLFFVFWLKSRQAIWFLWWGAALLFGALAAGNVILRGFEPDFPGLGITVAALVASFGCCWQGARAFEHRPPLWFPLQNGRGTSPLSYRAGEGRIWRTQRCGA